MVVSLYFGGKGHVSNRYLLRSPVTKRISKTNRNHQGSIRLGKSFTNNSAVEGRFAKGPAHWHVDEVEVLFGRDLEKSENHRHWIGEAVRKSGILCINSMTEETSRGRTYCSSKEFPFVFPEALAVCLATKRRSADS